mmetsp:Transcript_7281/g.18037  ORF Transcript_7281/g.18037 Transcript_7281/m.18037 type:complete len:171 (-) Transcript_7281:113-625(-)
MFSVDCGTHTNGEDSCNFWWVQRKAREELVPGLSQKHGEITKELQSDPESTAELRLLCYETRGGGAQYGWGCGGISRGSIQREASTGRDHAIAAGSRRVFHFLCGKRAGVASTWGRPQFIQGHASRFFIHAIYCSVERLVEVWGVRDVRFHLVPWSVASKAKHILPCVPP